MSVKRQRVNARNATHSALFLMLFRFSNALMLSVIRIRETLILVYPILLSARYLAVRILCLVKIGKWTNTEKTNVSVGARLKIKRPSTLARSLIMTG